MRFVDALLLVHRRGLILSACWAGRYLQQHLYQVGERLCQVSFGHLSPARLRLDRRGCFQRLLRKIDQELGQLSGTTSVVDVSLDEAPAIKALLSPRLLPREVRWNEVTFTLCSSDECVCPNIHAQPNGANTSTLQYIC